LNGYGSSVTHVESLVLLDINDIANGLSTNMSGLDEADDDECMVLGFRAKLRFGE
jgi:hypothetical protein